MRRTLPIAAVAAIGVLASLVRLRLLTHGAGLAASDMYDDGVYYAAADALVHGRLPYRDFLLLHPPGITLVLAPFAALGSVLGDPVGVSLARIAFLALGGLNTALIAVIGARHSRGAALVAGIGAAVLYPLAYSERTTLLEPVATDLLLWSLLLRLRGPARGHAALLSGLLAGAAVDVKAWYVVPVLLIGTLTGPGRMRWFAGAGIAAVAIAAPFLVAAPAAMVREVVLDQLGRPHATGLHALVRRLVVVASDPAVPGADADGRHLADAAAGLVLVAVVLAAIAAWRVRWARILVVLTAVDAAVLLSSPSFFPHYVAYVAPWMLLTLGVGAAEAARRMRSRWRRVLLLTVPVALVVGVNAPADLVRGSVPQPAAALHAVLAGRPGCVIADDPGLLADAGLLSPDLARGCPLWPDVTGWTYDRDLQRADGRVLAPSRSPRWQHDVLRYLLSGRFVVLARRGTGLSPASAERIARLPVVARVGRLVVHEQP